MAEMVEKTQTDDAASREAGPEEAATPEPGEIKGCVGATGGGEGTSAPLPPEEIERLKGEITAALKTVYDPEIPVDIYELGLIYRLDVDNDRNVEIDMTLTAPGCPVAGDMPGWVENAASSVSGVGQVKVNLVFDPPWDMSRMSEAARLELNMF
jgi:FeS assembly SUF system protein